MNTENIEQKLRQDVNLREAVRRNVMQTPSVPETLNTRLLERLTIAPQRKRRIWPWIAAAACLAGIVIFLLTIVGQEKIHDETNVPQLAQVRNEIASPVVKEEVPKEPKARIEEQLPIKASSERAVVPPHPVAPDSNDICNEDVPMMTEEQPSQLEIIYDNSPKPHNPEEVVWEMMAAYRGESYEIACSNEQGMHATVTVYCFAAKYHSRVFTRLQQVAEMLGAKTSNADFIQRNGRFSFELSSTIDGETVMDKWMTEENGNILYLYHTQDRGFDALTSTCFVEHIRSLNYESL